MRPSLFARTIHDRSNKENEKILAILSKQFDSQYYDYGEIFFTGNETTGLPRWSGYSLGYYFVNKYLKKYNERINDIFKADYSEFKTIL